MGTEEKCLYEYNLTLSFEKTMGRWLDKYSISILFLKNFLHNHGYLLIYLFKNSQESFHRVFTFQTSHSSSCCFCKQANI